VEDVKRWAPVVAYAALITVFSSIPGPSLPHLVTLVWDKLEHATEFAVFGFLLARAFGIRRWWWAILAGGLFGALDEFHQGFTPHRNGNDPGDMLADLVGSTVGALAFYGFHRVRGRVKEAA
jgi:VanZ family protein